MTPLIAIGDILLPRTDAAVGVQVLVVVALTALGVVAVRRERALVTLVIGVGMVVLGLMGMRALH